MDEAKWKLVPVEPTEAMLNAASQYENFCAINNYGGSPDAEGTWDAMLAASPTPPAPAPEASDER